MSHLAALARSYTHLGRAIMRFPSAPWTDALSHGQMQSKAWAVSELANLDRPLGLVYLVGGWLGLLPMLMFQEPRAQISKIRSFDADPRCEMPADEVNIDHVIDDWRFKAVTKDMLDVSYGDGHAYTIMVEDRPSYHVETCDTVINTSCDHIAQFGEWWEMVPSGKLVLLQNNDFAAGGADHVNTVANLEDLKTQAPMNRVLYEGRMSFEKYTRFMVIGIK